MLSKLYEFGRPGSFMSKCFRLMPLARVPDQLSKGDCSFARYAFSPKTT